MILNNEKNRENRSEDFNRNAYSKRRLSFCKAVSSSQNKENTYNLERGKILTVKFSNGRNKKSAKLHSNPVLVTTPSTKCKRDLLVLQKHVSSKQPKLKRAVELSLANKRTKSTTSGGQSELKTLIPKTEIEKETMNTTKNNDFIEKETYNLRPRSKKSVGHLCQPKAQFSNFVSCFSTQTEQKKKLADEICLQNIPIYDVAQQKKMPLNSQLHLPGVARRRQNLRHDKINVNSYESFNAASSRCDLIVSTKNDRSSKQFYEHYQEMLENFKVIDSQLASSKKTDSSKPQSFSSTCANFCADSCTVNEAQRLEKTLNEPEKNTVTTKSSVRSRSFKKDIRERNKAATINVIKSVVDQDKNYSDELLNNHEVIGTK